MDRGAWWANSPQGHKESDMTGRLTPTLPFSYYCLRQTVAYHGLSSFFFLFFIDE